MRPELIIVQHLRFFLKPVAAIAILGICLPLAAQTRKPSLPDPIKFVDKLDKVANVVRAVYNEMNLKIELDDRQAGRIVSRPYEFITGSLTPSEVDKVAIRNDTITGNWMKARYTAEAILEIVTPAETMVTIRTRVEALNRDVDGTEKWVALESLGTLERRILGKISMILLGNEAPVQKKGFWGKDPQPVDPRQPRFPKGLPR